MEIHILVPKEFAPDIESRVAPNFEITQTLTTQEKKLHFFRVETTEEEATVLILKYGRDQVWIR